MLALHRLNFVVVPKGINVKKERGVIMAIDKKVENLQKLSRTNLIMNFIKKHNGCWNHQDWLGFCTMLEEKGYTPIDFDQVGVLLETKKVAYFSK